MEFETENINNFIVTAVIRRLWGRESVIASMHDAWIYASDDVVQGGRWTDGWMDESIG